MSTCTTWQGYRGSRLLKTSSRRRNNVSIDIISRKSETTRKSLGVELVFKDSSITQGYFNYFNKEKSNKPEACFIILRIWSEIVIYLAGAGEPKETLNIATYHKFLQIHTQITATFWFFISCKGTVFTRCFFLKYN